MKPAASIFCGCQWFEVVNPASLRWNNFKLDMVHFPPMHHINSFGFVNPRDVLQGCHILPAFARGKRQMNEVGVSHCAKDGNDYNFYYVGHWGLGVGHIYTSAHIHFKLQISSS